VIFVPTQTFDHKNYDFYPKKDDNFLSQKRFFFCKLSSNSKLKQKITTFEAKEHHFLG